MKQTSHDMDAMDAAFDQQCRSILSGSTVPAPAPNEAIFSTGARPLGLGVKLVIIAGACLLAGSWMFLMDSLDSGSEQAVPGPDVHVTQPVTPSPNPSPSNDPVSFEAQSTSLISSESEALVEEQEKTQVLPDTRAEAQMVSGSEDVVEEMRPNAEGVEPLNVVSTESAALSNPESAEVDVAPSQTSVEANHMTTDDVGMDEADKAKLDPVAEEDAEETPETGSPQEEVPSETKAQPVLTLPLTLPSGGGH